MKRALLVWAYALFAAGLGVCMLFLADDWLEILLGFAALAAGAFFGVFGWQRFCERKP